MIRIIKESKSGEIRVYSDLTDNLVVSFENLGKSVKYEFYDDDLTDVIKSDLKLTKDSNVIPFKQFEEIVSYIKDNYDVVIDGSFEESKKIVKVTNVIKEATDFVKKTEGLINEIIKNGKITESEIGLIIRRLNSNEISFTNIKPLFEKFDWSIPLTNEQEKKAIKWLTSLYKTPSGKDKRNSPLGYREMDIIEKVEKVVLADLNSPRKGYYVPLYRVESSDRTMEYYVSGGEISIVG